MRTLIAGVALGLVAAGGGVAAAAPGDTDGFVCMASPGAPPPLSCSYVAKVEGFYVAHGTWTLTIKRGCLKNGTKCKKIIKITNPSTPGGYAYEGMGAVKPGDRVTGVLLANGTQMAVGNPYVP